MDILEETDVFLSACQLTQDESNNLVFNGITGCFESKYLADWFVNQINFGWKLWRQAQAVPEWKEYEKESPRIDGRYQIFINGEQLTANWETPFGFSSAEDNTAFLQHLITHWSMLPENPKEAL
ncbi:hypothetical protein ACDI99_03715 [Acinetobacter radioresistens]|uniref:hypothetical protein n=1 Tax=Acinetobacter radioresistens TaxID=40216 RepID=UPI0035560CE9